MIFAGTLHTWITSENLRPSSGEGGRADELADYGPASLSPRPAEWGSLLQYVFAMKDA